MPHQPIKILLVGPECSGKSVLLSAPDSVRAEEAIANYCPNQGLNFRHHVVPVGTGEEARLQLWDTIGNTYFQAINHAYFDHAQIILLMLNRKNAQQQEKSRQELRDEAKAQILSRLPWSGCGLMRAAPNVQLIVIENQAPVLSAQQPAQATLTTAEILALFSSPEEAAMKQFLEQNLLISALPQVATAENGQQGVHFSVLQASANKLFEQFARLVVSQRKLVANTPRPSYNYATDAGRNVVFNSLFAKEAAGCDGFFANTRAAFSKPLSIQNPDFIDRLVAAFDKGEKGDEPHLFAEERALWNGERALGANMRATWRRRFG